MVEYKVISIGTLSQNRLWGESQPVRASHATTTLVADGERRILVDPALPGQIIEARLLERTGQGAEQVTDVFCTTLRPAHRRGVDTFGHARWWVHENELDAYRTHLEEMLDSADRLGGQEAGAARADLELVARFEAAPERFTDLVTVLPLSGPSPGHAGLLLTPPTATIVVAGDAALTGGHLRAGQVWEGVGDREAALESLQDILELADIIIPGHDNVVFSPQRWM